MTPRENLLRTLRRQGFESVPVDMSLCPSQVEGFRKIYGHDDYPSEFGFPCRGIWMQMQPGYESGPALYTRETLPPDTRIDVWGVGHSRQEGCWHMTHMHHPLAGDVALEEIERYPVPHITSETEAQVVQAVRQWHGQGLAVSGGMACTIWETAWYLRSMENLMEDMMTDDARAVVLLDKVTAVSERRAETYARAGCDILHLGDDIGMQQTIMMSLDLWRKWLKPRLARVIQAARRVKPDILIFYHSCGYVLPFLEELIEVGVDILNPVQPECMDFEVVHRMVGRRLSFWGTIGTQTTLPFGTPDEVRETVWSRLRLCGPAGGIVIGPTHMVEPEVPWENLMAMIEAARSFRL